MSARSAADIRPYPAVDLGQTHAASLLGALRAPPLPSLLLSGPEGTGKVLAALELARALACERSAPCDLSAGEVCDACVKASLLEHPGIQLIFPTPTQGSGEDDEGDVTDTARILDEMRRDFFARVRFAKKTSIRIARSRAVIKRANTKPFGYRHHAFIFVDAHAMREEAQNALLKLVEEPPAHALLVFVTTNADAILYTIRSRCQHVRFSPLKAEVVERVLAGYYGAAAGDARRAAALSHGSITRARAVLEAQDEGEREVAAAFVEGLAGEGEAWAIGRALALGRGANREGVARFLDEVALLFRDVMAGEERLLVNKDMAARLAPLRGRWKRSALPGIIDRIGESRGRILLANASIDSTLADLFLAIHRCR
jgi:DNA polymerase-3 subunit delta'